MTLACFFSVKKFLFPLSIAITFGFLPTMSLAQQAAESDESSEQIVYEAPAPATPLAEAVQTRLLEDDGSSLGDGADSRTLAIYSFYEDTAYAPIWVDDSGPNDNAVALIEALRASGEDALHPADYQPELLADMANTAATLPDLADVEISLSKVFVDYATHLAAGRVEPNKFNREINLFPGAPDPVDVLTGIADTEEFADYVLALAPNTPNYDRLKRALALYRQKAEDGGWPVIPEGEVLKPGMEDPRVPVLLERMIAQDLYEGAGNSENLLYDGDIVEAVKLFQERHGLEVDGVIGKNTLAQINVPIQERIHQMELNMERRRWMKDDLGYKYVFANLADQAVKVVKGTKTIHWARIVVGKPYHRTPVFSENMTYAVVNPYWNVPRSIAVNEYLPKLRKNPGTLRAQNIRLLSGKNEFDPYSVPWNNYSKSNFPFRLRQDPGKGNALGRIKFMFPNKFNVYIHDTPSKSLFSRASRAFSHGCMRVQDPLALGAVLLADEGWDEASLNAQVANGKKRVIKLKEPIPVHVTYLTAWANKDGSIHFRRDIYDRDTQLAKALTRVQTN